MHATPRIATSRLALGQRGAAHELERQASAMAERVLRAEDPSLARYREVVTQREGASVE